MLSNHPNVLGNGGTGVPSGAAGPVGGPSSSTDNALVRWSGTTGTLVKNGVVTEANDTGTLTGPVYNGTTTAVGSAFTNQPSNDIVEVVSANAGDTTQTVTIIGTTTATNTVVVETVTLNGTTAVPTVKTDWGLILAVKKSAATLGTVTVRKKTGAATITAGLTAAVLSVGVNTVSAANQLAYNRTLSTVSDGATTKQIGFQGTNTSDAVIYDSKPLNGTTAVLSNSSFRTVTEIYTGDVEVARTETVTTTGSWVLTAGDITLTATGTNQGITLAPNGTGVTTTTSPIQVQGTVAQPAQLNRYVTGTGGASLQIGHARGTFASPLAVVANDELGNIDFYGYANGAFRESAYILATVDGAVSGSVVPSGIGIYTQTAGTPLLRLKVTAAGNTLVGGLSVDGTGILQFPNHSANTGGMALGTGLFLWATTSSGSGLGITGKIASYNAITTAGWGASIVQADGNIAATTNARSAAVATYTVGGSDGTFIVCGAINVTTSTAFSFSLDCVYTDDGNVSRTLVLPLTQLAGTFVATGLATNVLGAGPYESASMTIRAKASTSITIRPSAGGTYTTVVYNVCANIRQVG